LATELKDIVLCKRSGLLELKRDICLNWATIAVIQVGATVVHGIHGRQIARKDFWNESIWFAILSINWYLKINIPDRGVFKDDVISFWVHSDTKYANDPVDLLGFLFAFSDQLECELELAN
jgi:hypothetical protein